MQKTLVVLIAWAFLSVPVSAEIVSGAPPSAVGTAATGQIPGTATNDNAAAGKVGEYFSQSTASGSPVFITPTGTPTNMTASPLPLTAGDWDVQCDMSASGTATVVSRLITSISQTSATLDSTTPGARGDLLLSGVTTPFSVGIPHNKLGSVRITLTGNQNVYCVGQPDFTGGTFGIFGLLEARRVR